MHDQRVPGRPSFRRKDPRHRLLRQRVRSQPIHRLSRKRDQSPTAQNLRRARNVPRVLGPQMEGLLHIQSDPRRSRIPRAYTAPMQAPEIELKFSVHDIPAFQAAVQRLDFTLKTPRTFEANTLYDTPDRQLRAKRQILRIREYGPRFVLTHKRLADPNAVDIRYKTRIETETELQDGPAMAEVFCQLGFCPAFRYEKYRTEWNAAEGGHLVLDETPIGVWAELEGDPAWIDTTLAQLAVPANDCSTQSYGALFLDWKERTGSPAQNLTFNEVSVHAEPAMANS